MSFNHKSPNSQEARYRILLFLGERKMSPKSKPFEISDFIISLKQTDYKLSCLKWNRFAKIRQCFDKPNSFCACIPERARRQSTEKQQELAS